MEKRKHKNINILIIESNEDHLYFIKKALANFGYNFIEITKGTEAYNYLLNSKVKPDIVLLSNILPGMKGLEILRKLEEKKLIYNIIFQTIYNDIDLVVEAMRLGATDFILKTPELKYQLPQKIEKILENCRYETEKLETEAKFKSILESGDDDIWSIDTNYKITAFNQSYKQTVLNLNNTKLKIGDDILKIYSKQNNAFWKPRYEKVLKGEKITFDFCNPNDKLSRYYEIRLSPIIINSVVVGLSAIARDITERKKNEQELHKKNQLLSKHMNNTPLAAIYTDTNSIIKEWNTAAESVFGYSEKEALGKNLIKLVTPQRINKKIENVCNAVFTSKGSSINKNKNITKEGNIITCNWHNTLITDQNNKPIGSASLVEDITKQTQLESTVKSIENLTAAKIGKDYFNTIAKSLNKILKADYLFISKYNLDNHSTTSLAYLKKQKILPNITYDLLHTPCDLVSKEGYCFFGNNVDELFIKDTYLKEQGISAYLGQAIRNDKQEVIGQLVALFCKPILEDLSYKTLMRVFADKIGAEIERKALIDKLSYREQTLLKSQKIAKLGSYTLDISNNTWQNTSVLDTIFGIDTLFNKTIEGWLAIVHPDDRLMMQHYFMNDVVKNRKKFNKEYRILRNDDKQERWVHGLGELVFNEDGEPVRMIGTIQDITDRKLAEVQLQEANFFLQEAQNISLLGYYTYSFQTKQWKSSEMLSHLMGLNSSKGSLQQWIDLIIPEDKHILTEALEKRLKQPDSPLDVTYRVKAKGKIHWMHHTAQTPQKDAQGQLLPVMGVLQDVTKRKNSEEALQKSNEALQKAQTIAKLGSYSLDLKTQRFTSSLIFDTIVGLKPKDKKTFTTWRTITHPDDTLGNKKMLAHCIKTGEKFEREYRILTKDKKELKWLYGLGKIVYKNGTPVSFIGTIQDITDRKKIEIALKEKEQKLQEAHEITGLGTFIFDDSTDLFESSEICDAILGIDSSFKKDIQGWISLAHPKDYKQVQNILDNNSVTSTSQEFRIIRPKDKKIVWLLGHARKHFDANGKRRTITGTIQDITEQKINEETLSQYGYIIENSNTEILILDVKNLKIIKSNKAARKNLGYSIKEIYKMTPKDFNPNFSPTRFNKRVASLTNKDKTIVFTTVHKRKNGYVFPVEIALQKSTYLNKAVYIAFIKDISQRQRQEQIKEVIYNITKKANETQNLASLFNFIRNELATLIDTTNFFIALYDETTDLISTPYMIDEQDSNDDFPKGKSLTGYIIDSKKSLIGNHAVFKSLEKKGKISILGPPSKSWMGVPLIINQKAIGAMVIQSYKEENAYSQEDLALLELIASNMSTVIKHKQDFEQIKLLNQAILQSPEAVIITNTEGIIEYINPAFTNLSGYSRRDAIGKKPSILKSDVQNKNYYKSLWDTITTGQAWEGEFVNKRKDGSNYLVAANISSVKNKKGEITHYIAVEEDITEKRELERQFIHAFVEAQEVEKQAFGEDLHDGISQILAAESMYIDILIRQNKDRLDNKAKFLTKIKELNLSAIDEARNIAHGLMAKQLKEQGLIKAIEIICEDYNASRNIDFSFKYTIIEEDEISEEIKTHIFRLAQEITTNIIRHADAKKAEIILSKTEKNALKIIIKDNGVGIDYDKIKKGKKGAGLKNIERRITLLNGTMNIDTAPNKGTCFTIEVPLVRIQ